MGRPMSRRRRLRLARTVVVLAALTIVVTHLLVSGGSGGGVAASARGEQKVSSAASPSAQTRVTDPFDQTAVRSYLVAHHGISASIHDLVTGQTWTYRPGQHDTMASIMKLDILETRLRQGGVLSGDDLENATGMIENSNNDDAQDLWDVDGGASGVSAYNNDADLDGTTENTKGYWGLSTTTASDQVRLLDHVAVPNSLLDDAMRRQALHLMHNVEADQRWGVSAGLPAGAPVAIKNGWLPLDNGSGWEVNSDGIVASHGYHDDISVLTRGNATEDAGIKLIQGLTRLLWPLLARSA